MTSLLDGGSYNDTSNSMTLPLPFAEALQEFKVETSALPAQYGQHSGAALNALSRSGTNTLHGNIFVFLRNYAVSARNAFAPVQDGLRRNQFGGPIQKNKLFDFVGYQGTIQRQTQVNNIVIIPTPAMVVGETVSCTSGTISRLIVAQQLDLASVIGKSVKMAFMTASRVLFRCALTCLLVASLPAQNQPSPTVQNHLPLDALMIETADLSAAVGKPRELVLWMQRPEKILREVDHPGESYCGDSVYGDHWYGPTRLSLIDTEKREILNTLEIPDFFEHPGDGRSFPIPFFVPNDFYDVPKPNSKNEGTPRILNLRDLTGEGYAGQFVLFEYEFCGTPLTSVLGYSRVSDRAVQYQVEVLGSSATPSLDTWVATIFARQPVSPGHWDFTWEPGHGANRKIHEQVSFDPIVQLFVDRQETTPR